MAELPGYMNKSGRTNLSAPAIGGYDTIMVGPVAYSDGSTDTAAELHALFIAPYDMRLHRIWYHALTDAAIVLGNWYVHPSGTISTTGATLLHATADLTLGTDAAAGGYIEKGSGGKDVLAEAARDIVKDAAIFVELDADTAGLFTGFSVQYTYSVTGHANANAVDD